MHQIQRVGLAIGLNIGAKIGLDVRAAIGLVYSSPLSCQRGSIHKQTVPVTQREERERKGECCDRWGGGNRLEPNKTTAKLGDVPTVPSPMQTPIFRLY
jgi:hypothetical protein